MTTLPELQARMDALIRDGTHYLASQDGVVNLSYWSYSLYKECPQKYCVQALARDRPWVRRDAFWAISGSVIHSLTEDFVGAVKTGKTDWDDRKFLTEQIETYYDAFLDKNHVDWDGHQEDPTAHRTASLPLLRTSIDHLYDTFWREGLLPRDPNTIHSEISFKQHARNPADKKPVRDLTLTGRVDLVFENPTDLEVVDLKDVWKRSNVNWRQLIHYVFGLEPMFDKPVKRAGFLLTRLQDWSWRNPNGKDYRTKYHLELCETAQKIKREPFTPNVSRHHCPRCDLHNICPQWQRQVGRDNSILTVLQQTPDGTITF